MTLLLGTATAVALIIGLRSRHGGAQAADPYLSATVKRGTLTATVNATGSLAPIRVSELTAVDGGTVHGLTAHAGQAVKKGQMLARINDAGNLSSEVLAMEQTLASDEESLASQSPPLSTPTELRVAEAQLRADQQQLSHFEVEHRQAPMLRKLAAAQVQSDRVELATLEQEADGQISAPTTGQIAEIDVKPGQYVAQGQLLAQIRSSLTEDRSSYDQLTSPAAGRVVSIPVHPFQWIKLGTTVLRLSEPSRNLQVLQAKANLAQAQRQLAGGTYTNVAMGSGAVSSGASSSTAVNSASGGTAAASAVNTASGGNVSLSLEILKTQELIRQDEATLAELRSGKRTPAQVQAALLRVKIGEDRRALASLKDAQARLAVRAPFDGVVQSVSVQNGTSVQKGAALLTVADQSQLQLDMKIDELVVDRVRVGQPVRVTVDALAGKTFTGHLATLSHVGTVSNGRAKYAATVVLARPRGAQVGMTAEASIDVASVRKALLVPVEAIHTQGGRTVVVRRSGGAFRTVPVKTGLSDASQVQIVSGLQAGDVVVTSQLNAGQTGGGPLNLQGKNLSGPGGPGGPGRPGGPPPAGAGK